ncbi:MAG: NAD(P)-dependent alcohol dehydrogenase [Actinobacteria bacterium]|nr:NAD(P)-dependent alcohol dehydrogenase [Actinomycetota bacterium]
MRAAVAARYGPPGVVRIEEVDKPAAGQGSLLIKVHATTVNRTDCGYRGAKPWIIRLFSGLWRPRASILGTEFAGVVEAVGDGVTGFQAGDRVCGYCEGTFGAHAEYMTVAANRLIARIPEDRSYVEAAPSTEGSHYALGLFRRAGAKPGQQVLVYGATGAIGSSAVQIGKSLGLSVTAVCGTDHVDLVESLGADRVVDYQTEDFTKDSQRYDLVLDAVGKSSFRRCVRLLKPGGIYISSDLGFMWHGLLFSLITPLFRGRKQVFATPRRDPEAVRCLKGLIESGEFTPVIDRVYPLDEIVDAYRYVETGQKTGNVVITV